MRLSAGTLGALFLLSACHTPESGSSTSSNSGSTGGGGASSVIAASGPESPSGSGGGASTREGSGSSASFPFGSGIRTGDVLGTAATCAPSSSSVSAPTGGTLLWARALGAGSDDNAALSVAAADGRVAVTGTFRGGFDPGPGPITTPSGGRQTGYVTHQCGSGPTPWARGFAGTLQTIPSEVLLVPGGSTVVAGSYNDVLEVPGGCCTAHGFVLWLEPDGSTRWMKSLVGLHSNQIGSAAVDAAGHIWVAGDFYNEVDLGGGVMQTTGMRDALLGRYGPSGTLDWQQHLGGSGAVTASSVAARAGGGAVVTGTYDLDVTLGDMVLGAGPGDGGHWVAVLDADGQVEWARHVVGANLGVPGVAVSPDGLVVVAGGFETTVAMGALETTSANPGPGNIYVGLISASGAPTWLNHIEARPMETLAGAAFNVMADGRGVVVGGSAQGDVRVNGTTLTGGGTFAVAYTPAGQVQWLRGIPGLRAHGMSLDSAVFFAGEFSSTVTVDGVTVDYPGEFYTSSVVGALAR